MALTPANVTLLKKKGFKEIYVEKGAGKQITSYMSCSFLKIH